MKIVYCLNSIRYLGGIPRVTITKANALADIQGNDVYVIVTDNKAGVQTQQLSDKVHLIDLDINYFAGDTERSKLANYLIGQAQRRVHKKKLYKELCSIQPDVVISVGTSEKYMLTSMKNRTWKIIREFHIETNYRKRLAVTTFDKFVASVVDFYDFNFKEKKYDKIVVLTQEDKDANWKGWDNVSVMPNPVSFHSESVSSLKQKEIISLGRLDYEKNYSSLIKAFMLVNKRFPDWKLSIYGEGGEQRSLQQMIDQNDLATKVFLKGTTKDVPGVLLESSIFALSSIIEGFSLVLIEAMECGLPVVSYQCPGPKNIISDGKDGFLVPVGDEQMMADRICQLIEDEELRQNMGVAAKEKAKRYHRDEIAKQWMSLFDELVLS